MVQIVQIGVEAWQEYKKIQLEALQEDPQAFGSSYDTWVNATEEKWQERPANPDSIILLAKEGAHIIGLIGVHFEAQVAQVWGMYVTRNYRGKGVGKQLLQKLLEKLEAKK